VCRQDAVHTNFLKSATHTIVISLGVASLSNIKLRVWGQLRVASVTMNMIKQERGWAQATTELAERERTSLHLLGFLVATPQPLSKAPK
jgi:hypothetical protein